MKLPTPAVAPSHCIPAAAGRAYLTLRTLRLLLFLTPTALALPPHRLSWALVHSRDPPDVQRGIELAEALTDSGGLEQRDLLYLVAVRPAFCRGI